MSEWKSMESAPVDGTIVNVVGRYADAEAGFPRYAGFVNGKWMEFSRFSPQELVVWAWRERDDWPREGWIGNPDTLEDRVRTLEIWAFGSNLQNKPKWLDRVE